MSWQEIAKGLAAPFRNVHFRIGSRNREKTRGMVLTYIDARDVMDRLDEVVGIENWRACFREVAGRVVCTLSIRMPGGEEWITKEDGAGETDMEGEKGALSDALKRAFVHFGGGRYLYAKDNLWVALEQEGRVIQKKEIDRLHRLYAERHGFSEGGVDQGSIDEPPPPSEEYESGTIDEPQRDVKSEIDDAQALVAERKKLLAKQFAVAEKLWGKPIPQDRRFQIMDWVLKKMRLRLQNQINSVSKCREAMRWIDEFETQVDLNEPPPF